MNRVFREEKKYLIGMAEALQRSHLLGQVMREDPTTECMDTGFVRCTLIRCTMRTTMKSWPE